MWLQDSETAIIDSLEMGSKILKLPSFAIVDSLKMGGKIFKLPH